MTGQCAEGTFQSRRLVEKAYPIVFEPSVVGLPRLRLIPNVSASHHRLSGEQAKQAKLSEATEEEARIQGKGIEPARGDMVVDMPVVRQGDPDVYVREKK
jgi:hypothetical protein